MKSFSRSFALAATAAPLSYPRQPATNTSGCLRAMSSKRNAAPVGFLRPRSQLAAVTVGIFIIAAKTGWLTLSFSRIDRTCEGVSDLTRGGNGIVAVRRVSFCLPVR